MSEIQKGSEFAPRGVGGWKFSKISEIQKVLNYPKGGGSSLIGNFPQIFPKFSPFFLVTPPLKRFYDYKPVSD